MIEGQFTDADTEAGYYPCCEHCEDHEPGDIAHALPCVHGCNDE